MVNDAGVGVVAEVERAMRAVRRSQRHDHQEVGSGFADLDALTAHFLGQPRLDAAQPVLDVDLSEVDVGAALEGDGDRRRAVRGRRRAHVEEIVDAVHLLLDDRGDVLLERRGVGAGVGDVDGDRWGRDRRILLDRKRLHGEQAGQRDGQRDDPREDRPVDEEVSEHQRGAFGAGRGGRGVAAGFTPARTA